jgi:hypothetical protein
MFFRLAQIKVRRRVINFTAAVAAEAKNYSVASNFADENSKNTCRAPQTNETETSVYTSPVDMSTSTYVSVCCRLLLEVYVQHLLSPFRVLPRDICDLRMYLVCSDLDNVLHTA